MHVGTTTIENLLRVARSDAAAATAFAALIGDGRAPQIVSVPAAGSSDGLSSEELVELVRQASADPEFLHARVFVRSVRMGRALTLAVAPLKEGVGRSMIGIVGEPDRRFEAAQLEVLEQLAERFLRHLQVVQQLNGDGTQDSPDEPGVATSAADDQPPGDRQEAVPGPSSPAQPAEETATPAEETEPEGTESRAGWWPPTATPTDASPAPGWSEPDSLTGLPSLAHFFSRAGRMLAPEAHTTGALALVVVEVADALTTPAAARVLSAQLRFSDPLARVDDDLLVAAVLLFPAGTGKAVEQRLGSAVRSALERPGCVRTAHAVAHPGDRRDVDELLREAVSRLPDHEAGGGGAPWRGAGGSAARLPIP